MTVAERIKLIYPKDSIARLDACLKECMVFTSKFHQEVGIFDALFVDGSRLVVRIYIYAGF